jgi:O-antigen/teichoic acid export membrane protein
MRRIVRNVFSNWFALFVTTVVGFFLSPFVVHRLGNLAYGVWILVASLTSYMSLLDLGMRGAVTRFVSKGITQQNHEEASEAVSAALWIRLWISVAIICAGVIISFLAAHVFKIPADLQQAARIVIVISTFSVALNLWCGVFAGVLAALHRFEITSSISIGQVLLRAAGVVFLLRAGHSIVALAILDLSLAVVANAVTVASCSRLYPRLRIIFRAPSQNTLRKIWNYSLYAFLISIAVQVAYYSDNLVVGIYLSPSAVTYYAIGGMIIAYARVIVSSMSATFTPLASSYEAGGRQDSLQSLAIQGTRAGLLVSLPIVAALFFRGHTFIRLWMGDQYAVASGTVLQILLLSVAVSSANSTACGIMYGMEKHKRLAIWGSIEAVTNLVLSLILVRRLGIYGVAWGSAIPSVIIEVMLWPRYTSKLIGLPVRTFVMQSWVRGTAAVVPFAAACFLAERFWPAPTLFIFFLQIAVLVPLVPLVAGLVFRAETSELVRKWRTRHRPALLDLATFSSSAT